MCYLFMLTRRCKLKTRTPLMMRIYIIHYHALTDRKEYMDRQVKSLLEVNNNVHVEYVDQFDRDQLPPHRRSLFSHRLDGAQRAIAFSHLFVLREMCRLEVPYVLILEDDATFNPQTLITDLGKMMGLMEAISTEWDMFVIGEGCNHHAATKVRPAAVPRDIQGGASTTRCLSAYVVSLKCAQTILDHVDQPDSQIHIPIDHYYNKIAKPLNLQVFWSEPTLVSQGSENGLFKPSHGMFHVR